MIEEKNARNRYPDQEVHDEANYQEYTREIRLSDCADRGDYHGGHHRPPCQWVTGAPYQRHLTLSRKILPICHRPQHERPAPPGRRIWMGGSSYTILLPHHIFVIVQQVCD